MRSAKSILTSKYTWAGVFFVCCIVTLILNATNTQDKCTWKFKGLGVHGIGGCDKGYIPDEICTTAMSVKRSDLVFLWNNKEYKNSSMTEKCSWRIYTSAFNYLAVLCDYIFFVIFLIFLKNSRFNFKFVIGSAGAATASSVVSIILMIVNSKAGSKQIDKMDNRYPTLSFSQSSFHANIAFGILSLIFLIILVLLSFKMKRDSTRNSENGYNVAKSKRNAKENEVEVEIKLWSKRLASSGRDRIVIEYQIRLNPL